MFITRLKTACEIITGQIEALFFFNTTKDIPVTNISATQMMPDKKCPTLPGSFQKPTKR
jgi:hypothetical protein